MSLAANGLKPDQSEKILAAFDRPKGHDRGPHECPFLALLGRWEMSNLSPQGG
jgi:hypothetical protein